ncbi:MAG: 50S ribosomal protein L11 methyltransferase [Oscillospiraceae bacterium]|nr:50S ribosomal protein L11 methyltransferase [Oscillospiraceae bacterium]
MDWFEITVLTTDEGADIVSARLSMLGIDEVSVVQGRGEVERLMNDAVKYWDYADDAAINDQPAVKAYVADLPENEGILESIRESLDELSSMRGEIGLDIGSLELTVNKVKEEDWANNWKAYFKPINVGEKLLVCPAWEEVPEGNTRAVLKIDPGMAFGTGTHHTTRMCLELLEKHMHGGETIADIGCGSGILSAAAMLMGAKETVAVDIDPVAARIAAETAEANGIDLMKYTVYTGDILSEKELRQAVLRRSYDIVLANIVASVIIALAPLAPYMMHKDSKFIASGIIEDRLDEVIKALEDNGLTVKEVLTGEDWRALEAELK